MTLVTDEAQEKLTNVAQVTQIVRVRVEIWAQSVCLHALHHLASPWDEATNQPCSAPFQGWVSRPCPFPKCSPGERKEFCPLKAGLILFLSLCLVFVLMGLYCTSLQLMVSWDRNYRWNHSNLTFGNIGQSLLLQSPGLTPRIAWSTWAVSQSLKGFLLYRHLCLNGMCRDGIWAV